MSQHEYEALVEYSISTLDEANDERLDIRSLAWELYAFQECFDTGFTHFRVMNVLLKHRYVYQFNITEHPDYEKHMTAYDQLMASFKQEDDGFTVYPEPIDETGRLVLGERRGIDPNVGYYAKGLLHIDAGSSLWTRLVANRRLLGRDAVAPEPMPLQVVALNVVKAAQKLGYTDLIKWWYPGLTAGLFDEYICDDEEFYVVLPEDLATLKNDSAIQAIRAIVTQTNFLTDKDDWYGDLSMPSQDNLAEFVEEEGFSMAEIDFLHWWFFCDEDA